MDRTADRLVSPSQPAWQVVGHDWVVRLLQQAVDPMGQGPRHAYLVVGPPQVGKTTLGLAFAQALFCTDVARRPCGVCRSCRLMDTQGHPDFRLVQPTDRDGNPDRVNGLLRVEQAAAIVRDALLHPLEASHKFFLVQDVHRANDSFANKLLKTLEEPPAHVVLCLTAHDRNALLPTIVSRCQVYELRPSQGALLEQALVERWQASPEQAALLARLANGRLGWAVDQLAAKESAQERLEQIRQLRRMALAGRVERLRVAQQLASNRNDEHLFGMLDLWTSWWRDVLLAQAGCLETCSNIDQKDAITEDAQRFDPADVKQFLRTLGRIEGYLRHTVNTGLALDVLFLQLPRPRM